ncbi:MAG: hypothetical protein M1831_006766 [Alyxoria varia]|nr:MAG: hypothetical protein M1831_006766 [Alyxoria varia]
MDPSEDQGTRFVEDMAAESEFKLGVDATKPSKSALSKHQSQPRLIFASFIVVLVVTISLFQSHLPFPTLTLTDTLCRGAVTQQRSIESRALDILEENPLIDGHNDLLIRIRATYGPHIYDRNFTEPFENGTLAGQVDLPRMREGRYAGAFWSAFWPCPKDIFDFSTEAYDSIVRSTLLQLDLFNRLAASYPKHFPSNPTSNPAEALSAFRSRKLISPVAIEGLHQIGNSYANLRHYHSLGVRYATLTWNCHNAFADAAVFTFPQNRSSVVATPHWNGLSKKEGRKVVREMNRLGMLVDISHVSADTMRDVLVGDDNDDDHHHHQQGGSSEIKDEDTAHGNNDQHDEEEEEEEEEREPWHGSIAPPIFSHSSAYDLCPHPRNVPNDVLDLVKRRNSIVMVNISPDFIACSPSACDGGDRPPNSPGCPLPNFEPANNTLAQVVNHIEHIGRRIGFQHVGIGTDFDGIESTPVGLEDASKMPELVAEMLRRGISDDEAALVVGKNVLRVWGEAEKASIRLKDGGVKPVEDDVEGFPTMNP